MDLNAAAQKLAASALDQFVEVSGVPRPSGHCEGIRAYLMGWAQERGLECATEDGNVWIDAPAAPGFEDKPKVIVQGHMDMVCVAEEGLEFDFVNQPVVLVREGDLITADGTTLGADDGVGLAFGLALAQLGEGHGPLRIFCTYDEETTMAGASAAKAEVLDAEYLLNIDEDTLGVIIVSSAGVLEGSFVADYQTEPVAGDDVLAIALRGFSGGHSGGEIHRGLVNAIDELADGLLGLESAGIAVRIVEFEGGAAPNAIPAAASAVVAVPAGQGDKAAELLTEAFNGVLAAHSDEQGQFGVEQVVLDGEALAHSRKDSLEALELIHAIPRGVIAMSPIIEGLVQASNNLGVARMASGKLGLTVASRSCEDDDLTNLLAQYQQMASERGMAFADPFIIPAWPARQENRLCDLMLEGLESAGVQARRTAVHGGLEPSWFSRTKPSLQMISCGPTFWGEHSPSETLDTSTFLPFAHALLHTLQHI